jgi:hypothetical protein
MRKWMYIWISLLLLTACSKQQEEITISQSEYDELITIKEDYIKLKEAYEDISHQEQILEEESSQEQLSDEQSDLASPQEDITDNNNLKSFLDDETQYYGFMNENDEVIVDPIFDEVGILINDYFEVRLGGQHGRVYQDGTIEWIYTDTYEETQLLPPDKNAYSGDFKTFITAYEEAINEKDLGFIVEHMDDETISSYIDGPIGIEAFKESYELDSDRYEDSIFWQEMKTILDLGFVLDEDNDSRYVGPYIAYSDNEFLGDGPYMACTAESVNVRVGPSIESEVIRQLDYTVVYNESLFWYSGDSNWLKVILPDGQRGYVYKDYLRNAVWDYRAIFKKTDGVWQLEHFLSGD